MSQTGSDWSESRLQTEQLGMSIENCLSTWQETLQKCTYSQWIVFHLEIHGLVFILATQGQCQISNAASGSLCLCIMPIMCMLVCVRTDLNQEN